MGARGAMKITLRAATEADAVFARQAHHAGYRDVASRQFGWDEALQDRFFAGDWRGGRGMEIVTCDGVACGYMSVEEDAAALVVREIVVRPEFQGRGIGTRLLHDVLERATARGWCVRLGVLHQNRAQVLYRRLRFRETGRSETHVLMEWRPGG